MDPLLAAGVAVAPAAGLYISSWLAEVRGLHDWLVPGALWRTSHPHVVLTFDDGPHPERTPRLLDVLAEAKVRAVFFVVGREAERHPALVQRIAAEGHQLGNHTWSHPWIVLRRRRRIEEEIDRCQEVVTGITGSPPRFARPPYGMRDFRYYRVLRERGLTPVLWSRNLRDYWGSSEDVLRRRLGKSGPGDIVLLHDGDPKARRTIEGVRDWLQTSPYVGLL